MSICNTCLYQFDLKHCGAPDFGVVVKCGCYVSRKDFYKHSSRQIGRAHV